MEEKEEGQDPGEMWKNIREACTQIAEDLLDRNDKNIWSQSKTVKDISKAQKKIKLDMEATKDQNKREDLKRERNKIINTLHKEIEKKGKKLNEKIEEREKYKDDTNRMFQVIRQLQPKERKKILVHTEMEYQQGRRNK